MSPSVVSLRRALVVFVAAFALGVDAPVRAQEQGEARCGACRTTGKVEFDVGRKYEARHEHGEGWETLFCSEAVESSNMGLDWEVCARCKTPSLQAAAQAEYDALAETRRAWLAARRRVDEIAGVKDLVHVETTHFIVTWGIPRIKTEDKKTHKEHAAAHLYAQRLEQHYRRFQTLFDIQDEDNLVNKHYVMIFEKSQQHEAVAPVYAGMSGPGTQRRAGGSDRDSVIVSWHNKAQYPKDKDFHRHLIHNTTHQFTAVYYNPLWFNGGFGLMPPWLNDKYGWLDAGLAHWFEWTADGELGPVDSYGGSTMSLRRDMPSDRGISRGGAGRNAKFGQRTANPTMVVTEIALPVIDATSVTFCFQEQDTSARWKGTDWRRNVYKAVKSDDLISFAEAIRKPAPALSVKEHQFVWSWVDYMMFQDPKKVGLAIKLAKHEKPTRDILKEAFGQTSLSFEEGWKEWVSEQYAPNK